MLPGRDFLFIQGSGSAAIEAVLSSLSYFSIGIWSDGLFSRRAKQMAFIYMEDVLPLEEKEKNIQSYLDIVYAVQFETSESRYIDLAKVVKRCKESGIISIVDIVSAYPYYDAPDADILILSSAKQFRGLPVMGIVAMKRGLDLRYKEGAEYLSLRNYQMYAEKGQTPHTSLWPQLYTLRSSLEFGTWMPGVNAITGNAALLLNVMKDRIVGDPIAPVITIRSVNALAVSEILKDKGIEVYLNASYMADKFQVSCFNYTSIEPYEILADELKRLEKEGKL
jgi:aspartate aminotransferase-like enzyme